jgi:ABC-2 type transport system ATP-binding protein
MGSMLEIVHLTKTYPAGKKAVDDLSLTVNGGDIYGFIGPNGAGKTTTIRAAVGVMDFDGGEIFIDGFSVKKEPIRCKSVTAYIPDNPDLYDYLTGIQYLNYMGDMFRVSQQARETRIGRYGGALALTGQLGDLISAYSHGMKQKLALIAAFLHQPRLMVLDEPFVGLDPSASFQLKQMMRELCESGSAIFFSTHVLEVAEKLCDKIAIIKNGQCIASGTTEEVRGNSSLEEVFLEVAARA